MKKNFLKAFGLSLVLCAGTAFSACSGSSEGGIGIFDIGNVAGNAVETGEISALCPDGWTNIDVYDVTAETPETLAANELKFVKGGSDQAALLTNPYIDIVYHGAGSEIMQPEPDEWYDNVTEIESFTTGNYTWSGYSAQTMGVPFAYVHADSDQYTIEVWLYTREGAEDGNTASITDNDVLAILQSITF